MNQVRERILKQISSDWNVDYNQYSYLIAFMVCSEYFEYDYEEADFDEVVVIVEKEWLFNKMMHEGIKNPLDYLLNEYTSEDSYKWYFSAALRGKIVAVRFK